ncbi:uncharacterized protein [Primulina eburnea]|uniref:uncharacterized protein isoform X1 n=1 Tax=Primulina eburnea TaxID=1245227 RepID=UPI003C6C763B
MTDRESSPLTEIRNQRPEALGRPSKLAKIEAEDFSDGEEEEAEKRVIIDKDMNPNPQKIQRYLLAIEYIGSRFSGAQQQSSCRTVVGVLEEAFKKFIGQPVSIFCSSRTDAGVHALSNVCHVDVERISKRKPDEVLPPHEPSVVKRAVNHFLQKNEGDIMVLDVRCVPSDFHARYRAQERTYFYRLLSGNEPLSTFEKDRAWHVPEELDLVSMQQACQVLVGRHDFSSFRAAACQAKSPVRTLDELTVTEVASSPYFPSGLKRELSGETNQGFGSRKGHRCFVVTARARSFLYHQVVLMFHQYLSHVLVYSLNSIIIQNTSAGGKIRVSWLQITVVLLLYQIFNRLDYSLVF